MTATLTQTDLANLAWLALFWTLLIFGLAWLLGHRHGREMAEHQGEVRHRKEMLVAILRAKMEGAMTERARYGRYSLANAAVDTIEYVDCITPPDPSTLAYERTDAILRELPASLDAFQSGLKRIREEAKGERA